MGSLPLKSTIPLDVKFIFVHEGSSIRVSISLAHLRTRPLISRWKSRVDPSWIVNVRLSSCRASRLRLPSKVETSADYPVEIWNPACTHGCKQPPRSRVHVSRERKFIDFRFDQHPPWKRGGGEASSDSIDGSCTIMGRERKESTKRLKFPRTLRKKFQFISSSFAREDVSRSKWNNWYRLRMLTKTREGGMRFARKKWKVEEGGQLILESIANGWRRTVKQFQKFEWQVTIGHVRFASSLRAWPDENREKGNRFLCTAPRNGHVRPPFLVVSLINPECLAWKPLLFVSALGGHG